MSGECTHDGLTCFHFAPTAGRICGNPDCGFRYGSCTNKNRCAICMFEEQGPDACLCPRNIAAIRDARLKQLIRKHRVDRPAPACLPDDLREDWDDKEALKTGPRGCVLCKAGPRECPLLSAPVGHVDTPSGLHQAEPAAGHQAVPAARAAGAGCQSAAGAGCQPVDPAPVAAGPGPLLKLLPLLSDIGTVGTVEILPLHLFGRPLPRSLSTSSTSMMVLLVRARTQGAQGTGHQRIP